MISRTILMNNAIEKHSITLFPSKLSPETKGSRTEVKSYKPGYGSYVEDLTL